MVRCRTDVCRHAPVKCGLATRAHSDPPWTLFTHDRSLAVGSHPSKLKAKPIHRIGQHLREHSRQLVRVAQRIAHVSEVVVGNSAATVTHLSQPNESPMRPAPGSVETLHAEITRLRVENDDLRASALLWADLYERGVERTNVLENGLPVVGSAPAAMVDNPIRATLPSACPSCSAVGTVKQETTIKGGSTTVSWHCIRCGHGWCSVAQPRSLERGPY